MRDKPQHYKLAGLPLGLRAGHLKLVAVGLLVGEVGQVHRRLGAIPTVRVLLLLLGRHLGFSKGRCLVGEEGLRRL